MANTVGIPIEQAVNGVEDSIYMQSTSGSDGSYTLTVTFAVGTDLNTSMALVQNAVNSALSQLPQPVQAQGVNVKKVSTNILLIESLYSDDNRFDETFLSNYAIINLQNPIARLPGVGQVQVLGRRTLQHAHLARSRQSSRPIGLTVLDVQQAIQNQNMQVASGQIGGPPVPANQVFQFTVNTLGRLSSVKEFENIIVKSRAARRVARRVRGRTAGSAQSASIVRIKDVAKVELSQQQFTIFSGLSGRKAAHICVYALPGANALQVAQKCAR